MGPASPSERRPTNGHVFHAGGPALADPQAGTPDLVPLRSLLVPDIFQVVGILFADAFVGQDIFGSLRHFGTAKDQRFDGTVQFDHDKLPRSISQQLDQVRQAADLRAADATDGAEGRQRVTFGGLVRDQVGQGHDLFARKSRLIQQSRHQRALVIAGVRSAPRGRGEHASHFLRRLREHHGPIDEITRVFTQQRRHYPIDLCADRGVDFDRLTIAKNGQFHVAVAGKLGHKILIAQTQIVKDLHVALAVQRLIADLEHDVPAFERIVGFVAKRLDDEDAGLFFQAQLGPQGLVLGGRHFFAKLQLAGVISILGGGKQRFDLLGGQQVADVVARRVLAEDQADELTVAHGGSAAIARIQGGVDLDAHGGGTVSDGTVLDPRNDALGDRKLLSADGIAVDAHALLQRRQVVGQGQRTTLFEEGGVVDLDNRHVQPRHVDLHLGRHASVD